MVTSPYTIRYRGGFTFPVPPDELWDSLGAFDEFCSWWRWLSEFRADRARLESGTVLHGVVRPPLPYRMALDVTLEHCLAPRRIDARVGGDLEGDACLLLEPAGDGTRAEVRWTLEMKQRKMRSAARFARPVLRWGHDRVVDATVAGFRRQLRRREGDDPGDQHEDQGDEEQP